MPGWNPLQWLLLAVLVIFIGFPVWVAGKLGFGPNA